MRNVFDLIRRLNKHLQPTSKQMQQSVSESFEQRFHFPFPAYSSSHGWRYWNRTVDGLRPDLRPHALYVCKFVCTCTNYMNYVSVASKQLCVQVLVAAQVKNIFTERKMERMLKFYTNLSADLVAALASLQMYNLTHIDISRVELSQI